jgi:hypothetical protein
MDLSRILSEIDAQIASLQHARAILGGIETPVTEVKAKRGRPKGSGKKAALAKTAKVAAPAAKRTLSPAGRKAIADAMKKRWAERKKAKA